MLTMHAIERKTEVASKRIQITDSCFRKHDVPFVALILVNSIVDPRSTNVAFDVNLPVCVCKQLLTVSVNLSNCGTTVTALVLLSFFIEGFKSHCNMQKPIDNA